MGRVTGWGIRDFWEMEVGELRYWAAETAKFQKAIERAEKAARKKKT